MLQVHLFNLELSDYNLSFNTVRAISHFRSINNDILNKDTYVVPEQSPLIILDAKYTLCMANNDNYTKHTIHIA